MLTAKQTCDALQFTRGRLSNDDHGAFLDLLTKLHGGGGEGEDAMTDAPPAFEGMPERGGTKARLPGQPGPDGMIHDMPPMAVDEKQREAFMAEHPEIARISHDTTGIQAEPTRRDRQKVALAQDSAAKAGVETDLSKTDPELFASIARIGRA
jgi:hypothetical protein